MATREEVKSLFIKIRNEINGIDFDDLLNKYNVLDKFDNYAQITLYNMDVYVDKTTDGLCLVNGDNVHYYDEKSKTTETFYFEKELFPTKENVYDFLMSLQWQRMTKKELEKKLQTFFNTKNHLCDSTDEDCKELDYSCIFTNGQGACGSHFIDVEIYYLKMRQRNHILITGSEMLDYVE